MKKALKTLLEIQDHQLKMKQQQLSKAREDAEKSIKFLKSLQQNFKDELHFSSEEVLWSYERYFEAQSNKILAYEKVKENLENEITNLEEELSQMFGETKKIESIRDKLSQKEKQEEEKDTQKSLDEISQNLFYNSSNKMF